nr:MAG TPA: hypothetical protein [Caudoviricetes sp.]
MNIFSIYFKPSKQHPFLNNPPTSQPAFPIRLRAESGQEKVIEPLGKSNKWLPASSDRPKTANAVHPGGASASGNRRQPDVSLLIGAYLRYRGDNLRTSPKRQSDFKPASAGKRGNPSIYRPPFQTA